MLEGDLEEFRRRDVEPFFEILPQRDWRVRDLESEQTVVVEAMLAPRSRLIGQTIKGCRFRQKYGMTALAIWRAGRQLRGDIGPETLQFGDALLLQGPRRGLGALQIEPDLIVLADPPAPPPAGSPRIWIALAIMLATLAMVAIVPELAGEVMLSGALAMVLTRTIGMEDAYRAIEWRSVFLVAGMLPLGLALARSGAAASVAGLLLSVFGAAGSLALLGGSSRRAPC